LSSRERCLHLAPRRDIAAVVETQYHCGMPHLTPSIRRFAFRSLPLLVLPLLLALGACGTEGAQQEASPQADAGAPAGDTPSTEPVLQVAASFAVLADIVSNVAGERAEVWSVVPGNAEPHTYEASPQDLARLTEADLLVMVGGRF